MRRKKKNISELLKQIKKLWNDKKSRKIIVICLIAVFSCVVLFFGYKTVRTLVVYKKEAVLHDQLEEYRPEEMTTDDVTETDEPTSSHAVILNRPLAELKESNSDLVGWLTIPATQLDYPFVKNDDNKYYLNHTVFKKWLDTGTPFLDYRNNADFLDYYSLIYGHHMKNGTMFGTVTNYADQKYFDRHPIGWLYTLYQDFRIDFFAYLVIGGNDANVYDTEKISVADNLDHIRYFRENARTSRDIGVKPTDRLIVLSTCTYEFNNARAILVGRLVPVVHK